jgi:peptidoglycan hydrolase-like amidase
MRGFALAAVALAAACGGSVSDGGETIDAPTLMALCEVDVRGVGILEVETDYLPHVVQCENGAASTAALEAQAIAARSYLYYKLGRESSISDGQGDQVYSCDRDPTAAHLAAVQATAGRILRYRETQVAAFYVAGARNQDPPGCRGSTDDPTGTEDYVTYNEGLAGDAITQTSLGWVDPSNDANRGCMSQNGADCLSDAGATADEILRFYYGEDIEIASTGGPCVL